MKTFLVVLLLLAMSSSPATGEFKAVPGHAGWTIEYDTPQPRPWGYEQDFVLRDSEGKEHSFSTRFKDGAPDKSTLDSRIRSYIDRLNSPVPEPERTYQESEVVEILVEKGYLKEGDKLDNLEVKK